jgi:hypothetical protein
MVLRRAYILVAGDARRLRESHLRAMAEAAGRRSSGQTLQLPGHWRLHVTYDFLRLSKNPALDCPYPPLPGEYPVSLPQSTGAVALTRLEGWNISIQIVTASGPEQITQAQPFTAYFGLGAFDPEALDRGAPDSLSPARRSIPAPGHDPPEKAARFLHRRQDTGKLARSGPTTSRRPRDSLGSRSPNRRMGPGKDNAGRPRPDVHCFFSIDLASDLASL